MSSTTWRFDFACKLEKHLRSAMAICVWHCLALAAILSAASLAFAVQGSFQATGNATVNPTGPRTGFNGTDFFNIESTANGNFASYGVLDIPLSSSLFPGAVTGINSITLKLTQNNSSFTAARPGERL